MTVTFFAPASWTSSTRALTTSGLVQAAISGVRSQPMFGLMMTLSPFPTKRFMPPRTATASLVIAAGDSPSTTARSGARGLRRGGTAKQGGAEAEGGAAGGQALKEIASVHSGHPFPSERTYSMIPS